MTKQVVIWHGRCHDGLTAAWCARQALPEADLYEAHYGDVPDLERLRGADVLFVDFCWKKSVMREVRAVARSILVLDHHVSARDDMLSTDDSENIIDISTWSATKHLTLWQRHRANVVQDDFEGAHNTIYCLFDMERSGAGLAWDVLCAPKRRPFLVDLIEDRDLWRFRYVQTKAVHAACGSYPLTIEVRAALMKRDVCELAAEGQHILRYHDKLVVSAAKHALRETIGGHSVPSLACPNIELISDLGNKLCVGEPFAAVWHDRADGTRYYSLRSDENGLDVSKVATSCGGGGHARASGFIRKSLTAKEML